MNFLALQRFVYFARMFLRLSFPHISCVVVLLLRFDENILEFNWYFLICISDFMANGGLSRQINNKIFYFSDITFEWF